jgi:hypothetical protein
MKEASDDVRRIYAKFDEENRRIIWAVQQTSSSGENDSLINLDLRWGIRPNSTFNTWSGASFKPSCLEFFNNALYRGDDNGYVYYHDPDVLSDPKVDTVVAAADWNRETIIWNYVSTNYSFGSTFFRKKPTRILLCARNIANTSIQINSLDDDGKRTRALKPIRWRRNFVWGDLNFVWGSLECVWKSLGVIEQWRRFPARGLRVSYCQIQITNAYSVVSNSDSFGQAVFDGAANTATLVDTVTYDWNEDAVDYFISTSVDDYDRQFKVLSKTADVLTLIDPTASLPTGTFDWVLSGYKKAEPINLQSYVVHTAEEDQNQITYHSGDDGANA